MAKTSVQPGNVIDVDPGASVASGQIVKVGQLAAVCLTDGASGTEIAMAISEVFEVAKETGKTFAVGDYAYLDAANSRVTSDLNDGASPPTTFIKAGIVIEAAGSSATTAKVKLNAKG